MARHPGFMLSACYVRQEVNRARSALESSPARRCSNCLNGLVISKAASHLKERWKHMVVWMPRGPARYTLPLSVSLSVSHCSPVVCVLHCTCSIERTTINCISVEKLLRLLLVSDWLKWRNEGGAGGGLGGLWCEGGGRVDWHNAAVIRCGK